MKKSSAEEIRQKIIGLGEGSVKKSYYPLLQEKIRDLEGKQKQLMEVVRSLEERETELEQLLETKTALLKEVNHRVKNNLQIIGSLLSLGSEGSEDLYELSVFEKTRKRIETISMIYQDFLYSENYLEVTSCAMLRNIARDIKSENGRHHIKLDFDFPMEEIIIDIDTAIPLALIANEVISNAISYAYEGGDGILSISFKPVLSDESGKSVMLIISDTGPGFPVSGGEGRAGSFGLMLIDALVQQIDGERIYENTDSGVKFTLVFQLK